MCPFSRLLLSFAIYVEHSQDNNYHSIASSVRRVWMGFRMDLRFSDILIVNWRNIRMVKAWMGINFSTKLLVSSWFVNTYEHKFHQMYILCLGNSDILTILKSTLLNVGCFFSLIKKNSFAKDKNVQIRILWFLYHVITIFDKDISWCAYQSAYTWRESKCLWLRKTYHSAAKL